MFRSKIHSTLGLIVQCVWLFFAFVCFFGGLSMFLSGKDDGFFGAWLMWGLFCCFPVIFQVIKFIIGQGRDGAVSGSSDYSASVSGNSVYVSNTGGIIRGVIIGLVLGGLGCAVVGPIWLGIRILTTLISVIVYIVALIKARRTE